MYCFFDENNRREAINISPGEYFASSNGMIIHTILGSCAAVALHDPGLRSGGMNNFLVPDSSEIIEETGLDYGAADMEGLIESMVKNGSSTSALQAKVIGGFCSREDEQTAAARNIDFVLEYLEHRGIEVISRKTGGPGPRKVYYYPDIFKIKMKTIEGPDPDFDEQMKAYRRRLNLTGSRGRFGRRSSHIFGRLLETG